MKRFLEIGGVVAGVLLIAFGAAAIYKAVDGRSTVSHELGQQKITGASFMTPPARDGAREGGRSEHREHTDPELQRREPAHQQRRDARGASASTCRSTR